MLVPVTMCIWVAANNFEKPFQLFLFLKLLYQDGKAKLKPTEIQAIAQMMGYADTRPVYSNLKELEKFNWIRYNAKTEYYILKSFDNIRKDNNWISRASVECRAKDISSLFAFIGAAIYAYQHKDFWRKVKRGRSVRIKGRTYHSLPPSLKYKTIPAPVATTGIEALHGISKSKASALKNAAAKKKYIWVKKDYKELPYSWDDIKIMIKYGQIPGYVKKEGEKYLLQQIDLVLPRIPIKRRHNLGT